MQLARDGLSGPEVGVELVDSAPGFFQLDAVTVIAAFPDGSVVTKDKPAQGGQVIVLYAGGMGQTTPKADYGVVPVENSTEGVVTNTLDMFVDSDLQIVAQVVAAYVANNRLVAQDLPGLISSVHQTIASLRGNGGAVHEPLRPAVSIKRSVTDDYIICLEDGKKFKSLKRHLRTQYNMTPEQYREKWGLAADYPMVAPNYAAARSQLAKQMGLGQQRRRRK